MNDLFKWGLVNYEPCTPSRLLALPIIDMRFMCLRPYAPYPSLIRALCTFRALRTYAPTHLRALTLINRHLMCFCLVLLQIPLRLSVPVQKILIQLETTMDTRKDANFQF